MLPRSLGNSEVIDRGTTFVLFGRILHSVLGCLRLWIWKMLLIKCDDTGDEFGILIWTKFLVSKTKQSQDELVITQMSQYWNKIKNNSSWYSSFYIRSSLVCSKQNTS